MELERQGTDAKWEVKAEKKADGDLKSERRRNARTPAAHWLQTIPRVLMKITWWLKKPV
jgi:hypothetical protein